MSYIASKTITTDTAHRVPDHESKCKHLHGHTYRITIECIGELRTQGSEKGMVTDFSVLKTFLMNKIHFQIDHGLICYWKDPLLTKILPEFSYETKKVIKDQQWDTFATSYHSVFEEGTFKILYTNFVPTAENIAAWIYMLAKEYFHSSIDININKIIVQETPSCLATYKE